MWTHTPTSSRLRKCISRIDSQAYGSAVRDNNMSVASFVKCRTHLTKMLKQTSSLNVANSGGEMDRVKTIHIDSSQRSHDQLSSFDLSKCRMDSCSG